MSKPSRIHLATNHVKISSDMDMESLKKSMMGVTSFTIWRDGDEEPTQEEVMLEMLLQRRGKLTSVSMPKVNLTGIHFTYQSYIHIHFPRRHFWLQRSGP